MNVFLSLASLKPGYGGPAYSVARLADGLAQAGVRVALWASDQSAPQAQAIEASSSVELLRGSAMQAMSRFGGIDVVHDNGLWLSHNHRLARISAVRGTPRVVSTRGMLEPWALEHKRWKKRLAWWLYQRRDLRTATLHHAAAVQEAQNVEALALGVPISVIPNGVDIPDLHLGSRKPRNAAASGTRTALFLGRLYPVKGLPMLIEAWSRVRPKGWMLRIAGPDEAGHQAELMSAVVSAGLEGVVTFPGPLAGSDKRAAFLEADLFLLPSHSESFGMAIAEALAHALPVLSTTGTPWRTLDTRGCGWLVEPTVQGIAEGLRRATILDSNKLRAMGLKGRDFVSQEFGWDRIVQSFIAMYEELLRTRRSRG